MTPKQKTPIAAMRDRRRPKMSPEGAASREPSAVPALSMATMMETSLGERPNVPVLGSSYPVVNCLRKDFIARMPLMVLLNEEDNER